eukprot:gnl/MRDRNA2_/MRDRNA2_92626_c0_seq1.p1 gnl/MRDRNA2_/MRDRNA2_92626_c0~~gnl/MRDRNA2_/MRDRNA2_92626_c0_seq1.p1  ORF type:complete len:108 (+),score=25.81 gnl/MRDRNA2_/MRDRNA2_92626_c0_seq1:66-389(+)
MANFARTLILLTSAICLSDAQVALIQHSQLRAKDPEPPIDPKKVEVAGIDKKGYTEDWTTEWKPGSKAKPLVVEKKSVQPPSKSWASTTSPFMCALVATVAAIFTNM